MHILEKKTFSYLIFYPEKRESNGVGSDTNVQYVYRCGSHQVYSKVSITY